MTEPWSKDALALADSLPDGVVVADADGQVTLVSRTAAAMLSTSSEASVGKPLSEVLALRDQEGNDWHATNRPYDGLRTRSANPDVVTACQAWIAPQSWPSRWTGRSGLTASSTAARSSASRSRR